MEAVRPVGEAVCGCSSIVLKKLAKGVPAFKIKRGKARHKD
jgi:hypothetical protein